MSGIIFLFGAICIGIYILMAEIVGHYRRKKQAGILAAQEELRELHREQAIADFMKEVKEHENDRGPCSICGKFYFIAEMASVSGEDVCRPCAAEIKAGGQPACLWCGNYSIPTKEGKCPSCGAPKKKVQAEAY
jgi:hypothetical protein